MVEQTLPEPAPGFNLGVSVSESPDLAQLGLTETHLRMALGEVARATLIAHGRITYGGHLAPSGYTAFLVHECERYGSRNRPFIGCVPLSVHSRLTTEEIRSHQRAVGLLGQYIYLDVDGEIIAEPDSRAPQTALDRDTTVRSLTGLRKYVTGHTDGRLVLGGKRTEYEGRIPGVIEETILSIRAGKPIFVAGGFGGVAGDATAILGLDPDGWLKILTDHQTPICKNSLKRQPKLDGNQPPTDSLSNRTANLRSPIGQARSPHWS